MRPRDSNDLQGFTNVPSVPSSSLLSSIQAHHPLFQDHRLNTENSFGVLFILLD